MKRQLKDAFTKFGYTLKDDFYKLKYNFTVRSFLTLFAGAALFAGNLYLFVASAVKMFAADGAIGVLRFTGGLIGFLVSCFLIFYMSVHFSVTPQEKGCKEAEGGTILSDVSKLRGKQKAERIALIIAMFLLMWGGGGAALGYYIAGEVKYKSYPQTVAEIVSLSYFNGDYTAFYEYTVDGETYRAKGKLQSRGEAVPRVGDTVTVRYDPSNPAEIRIGTESKFFLAFGAFLIFFGIIVIVIELYMRGRIPTPFLLAFILLGFTACIFLGYLSSYEFHSLVSFFARNFMLHFVLMFTNVGIIELFNGLIYIGYNRGSKKTARRKKKH